LFFDTDAAQDRISHVRIYSGNGVMVNAAPTEGVVARNLSTKWGGYWLKTGTYVNDGAIRAYANFKSTRRFQPGKCPTAIVQLTLRVDGAGRVQSDPPGSIALTAPVARVRSRQERLSTSMQFPTTGSTCTNGAVCALVTRSVHSPLQPTNW
jgi:hypothetical protein